MATARVSSPAQGLLEFQASGSILIATTRSRHSGISPASTTSPIWARKTAGLSGDVYVGFFNPLLRSFGDPTNTTYFMVMNGLGGNLSLPSGQSDNTATVAETRQQMTLNFDFGITGINSLLRLNRNTGQVDVINTGFSDGGNTVLTSLGGGKYQLQLKLDGGTGDLFKYNDGTAFRGCAKRRARCLLG